MPNKNSLEAIKKGRSQVREKQLADNNMEWYWIVAKCQLCQTCGTAQFKLDIYTHVALELFNKFVEPLTSYTQAHNNLILDWREWCTHEVNYSRATYHKLCVNCTCDHLWIIFPLILHDVCSIQLSSSIVQYFRDIWSASTYQIGL